MPGAVQLLQQCMSKDDPHHRRIVSEMYTARSVHYHGRGVLDDRIGPLKYYYSRTYIQYRGKVTKRPSIANQRPLTVAFWHFWRRWA